jgi:hypothetical protein
MKKIYNIIVLLAIPCFATAQVVMTDKAVPVVDNSAILKLDSDKKGVLYPRIPLTSSTDIVTVPNPQNGNVVFNTNSTATLPQTVAYFDAGKWNALYTKEQVISKFDLVSISSVSAALPISIAGFKPGNFTLGTNSNNDWTSLNITDTKTFTRATNSLAFTLEGMTQLDKSTNKFYEYAIGIFVDGKLAAVRKYHKHNENFTCSWHKFVLNGVINNLSVGVPHTIEVKARNISATNAANTPGQIIVYGGPARYENNNVCDNISTFMSKMSLTTTVVESLN